MRARYYRSGVKRGATRIVPTKRFFTLIAAVAAIIVVIVLLVTLIPASEQDKTINDIAQGETETVPATEDDTEKAKIQETQVAEPVPEITVPEEEQIIEDPQIQEETTTPEPVPDPSSYEVLQEGDSGQSVYKLQDRLIELGYLESGNSTGSFGPMTAEAVTKFQRNNNLEADGIAGGKTQAVLFSDSAVAA